MGGVRRAGGDVSEVGVRRRRLARPADPSGPSWSGSRLIPPELYPAAFTPGMALVVCKHATPLRAVTPAGTACAATLRRRRPTKRRSRATRHLVEQTAMQRKTRWDTDPEHSVGKPERQARRRPTSCSVNGPNPRKRQPTPGRRAGPLPSVRHAAIRPKSSPSKQVAIALLKC